MSRQDCAHPFWLRVPSSDLHAYEQVFFRGEYDFVVDTPPHAIVDAGANVGLASIYFANRYPDAKIIAIEPERSNFELLQQNVALYPNVVPVQAALWDRSEDLSVVDRGYGKWGFMTETAERAQDTSTDICHTVRGVTVGQVMRDHNLERIDVLKIDIEGAEKEVFNDTSDWLEHVDSIIVELHDRMKPGCSSAFYAGSRGFDDEWQQGENIYLSRKGRLRKR